MSIILVANVPTRDEGYKGCKQQSESLKGEIASHGDFRDGCKYQDELRSKQDEKLQADFLEKLMEATATSRKTSSSTTRETKEKNEASHDFICTL